MIVLLEGLIFTKERTMPDMRQREDWTQMHADHDVDVDTPSHHHMHAEDGISTFLEEQTSKVPSVAYLGLAVAAMGVSLGLQISERESSKHWSLFFGQWAPTILIIGLYNKFVKRFGH
jgi:hypothetical protein